MTVVLDGGTVRRDQVVAVARHGEAVELAAAVLRRLAEQRAQIEALVASGRPVYGVSTGFGALANTYIAPDDRTALQQSLIRSHSAGLGDAVEVEVVRAMMLCRLRTLVSGVTGVRPSTAAAYAALLNARLTPVVHEFGSLGCSGDLAPLAHVALALIGEGTVLDPANRLVPAGAALAAAGIEPVVLAEKEGLALINGTDGMVGMAVLALADLADLATLADLTAAMSIQALRGTDRVFAEDVQALRPHPGQAASAANLRALLAGSPIVADHLEDLSQVQDAYSLRCSPQVHGALRDTMAHAAVVLDRELAARIDNPSVLPDGRLESSGNFHGAPVAYVLDFLAIPVADVASMAERRTDRLLDPARSFGLPPFLAHRPGVDSGLMIAQYTQAGIVAELQRSASRPASSRSPRRRCRRTTSRWAGTRRASCVGASTDCAACSRSSSWRPRARCSCAPPRASAPTAAIVEAMAARGSVPGPDRGRVRELAACEAFAASGEWRRILSRHLDHLA